MFETKIKRTIQPQDNSLQGKIRSTYLLVPSYSSKDWRHKEKLSLVGGNIWSKVGNVDIPNCEQYEDGDGKPQERTLIWQEYRHRVYRYLRRKRERERASIFYRYLRDSSQTISQWSWWVS